MTDDEPVLKDARAAMAAFRHAFGCELKPDTLAEVYVARKLGLTLALGNHPGFDATAPSGERYQVKQRATTSIVVTRSFDFDYMILVTLNDNYEATAMYRVTQEQARTIFRPTSQSHRWEVSQKKFIAVAESLPL